MFPKIIIPLLLFGLIFPVLPSLQAEEASLVDPGLKPDNLFYPLKLFWERVQTAFTFGDSAKAERLADLAEKRLAEAKVMIEEEKEEKAEASLNRYQELLDRSLERAAKVADSGQDASALQEKVIQMTEKHLQVLERVAEKVPQPAQEAVGKALEISATRQRSAFEKLGEGNAWRAAQLGQERIGQRLAGLEEKVAAQDEEGTAKKLVNWQEAADFLKEISAEDSQLSISAREWLEESLAKLEELQEEADVQTLPLGELIREARSQNLAEQLEFLRNFQEENPEEAAVLLGNILEKRLTAISNEAEETKVEEGESGSSALADLSRLEIQQIGTWLEANGLNEYGDPEGTLYTGGTPLFDEETGESQDRFSYLLEKFPDKPWLTIEVKEGVEEKLEELEDYLLLWQEISVQPEEIQPFEGGERGKTEGHQQVEEATTQALEKLNELYQILPEESREGIGRAIENLGQGQQQRIKAQEMKSGSEPGSAGEAGSVESSTSNQNPAQIQKQAGQEE